MCTDPCTLNFPQVREIELFGKKVPAKNYVCSYNGKPYCEKPELKLQLSILPTRYCQAHCPFCIAAPNSDPQHIDLNRIQEKLEELHRLDCLRGISVTGGEPFTDISLLNKLVHLLFSIFGKEMEITLYTNGSRIEQLSMIDDLYYLDTIHISRHHWDDQINNRIFGQEMPSFETLRREIRKINCPSLFVFNCMLLEDGVASAEDVHRYLDFAIDCGVGKVSFITATPVNPWTQTQRVLYEEAVREDDPDLLFIRCFKDFEWCRCKDGVYRSPENRLMEFYVRHTDTSGLDYCRGLVIEPDGSLRNGYGGELIAP